MSQLDDMKNALKASSGNSNIGRTTGKEESPMPVLDYIVTELSRQIQSDFALKGGYALAKILQSDARLTRDVDLSIESKEAYEEFKPVLEKIGEYLIKQGQVDRYVIKDEVRERMSGGADYYKNNVKLFGVDIGLHQIAYGVHRVSLDIADVLMFEPERMVADKVSAILSRKRFRRVKDVYDLYCISNIFDLDYKKLKTLVDMRMEDRLEDWDNIPFSETVLIEYEKAYNKLRVQDIVTQEDLEKPGYSDVIQRFYRIADILKSGIEMRSWDCVNHVWRHL